MVAGVIYLSRLPRFMTPERLREELERCGPIGRIYLRPESDSHHAQRLAHHGRKAKLFEEGWVEFLDKQDAKKAAALLNAQPVGGKKCGNDWHDELWTIR